MPRVSVVIPCFNHARFVREAIESVAAQTHRELELIVVDDGSSDDSPEVIRAALRDLSLPRALLLEQRNAGTAAAIERGVAEAQGEILAILNSDDRFAPERIERLLGAAPSEGDFLLFSKARMINASGLECPPSSAPALGYRHALYEASRCPTVGFALLRNNIAVSSGNLFFPKSLYRKLGGFAPFELASDWDFLLRSLLHVEPVFVPEPLLDYRTHGSNTRLGMSAAATSREGREIINRYFALACDDAPANPLAPCERNWPLYFDLFVSRYHSWFGSGPIRDWMEHPPRALPAEVAQTRWRSWSGAVDFERVDDCDYLVDSAGSAASRAALAIARDVLVSGSHPLAGEEGPGDAALAEVFERQRPGRPRLLRPPWYSPLDRSDAPAPLPPTTLRRVGAKLGRRLGRPLRALRPGRWQRLSREASVLARSPLFDADHYRAQRSGLRGGRAALLWHYLRRGAAEGLNPHPLFDTGFYLRTNPDLAATGANPLAHYLVFGGFEGRAPNPLFDSSFYLETHPDVAERGSNPLLHYLRHGAAEGRHPHPRFDAAFYREQYAAEIAVDADPLAHYLEVGRARGFAISPREQLRLSLEASELASRTPALRPRDEQLGRRIRASGFFEDEHYRRACGSDFEEAPLHDTLRHFLERGSVEGLRFCSNALLEERLRRFDVEDESKPELAYLRDGSKASAGGRTVSIHVSSCGNPGFRESAQLLAHGLRASGAEVALRDERAAATAESDCDIVVAPHEFFLLGEGPCRLTREFLGSSVLWLAEEPGSKNFSISLWFARFARAVLDVNPLTALMWGALGFRARALPLGYLEGFAAYEDARELCSASVRAGQTPQVRDYAGSVDDPWSDRPLDVFCNAVLSERRDRSLAQMAGVLSSLRCALFLPSAERPRSGGLAMALEVGDATALAQRAKIQLNIHRGELPHFDWHGLVVRGIWQKSLVVSEPCLPVPGLIPGEHYLECELEDMPRTLERLLRTPAGRAEAEAIRKRAFESLVERYPMQRMANSFLAEEATWPS